MSLSFIVFIVYCLLYHCLLLQMCSSETKYKYDKAEMFFQDTHINIVSQLSLLDIAS